MIMTMPVTQPPTKSSKQSKRIEIGHEYTAGGIKRVIIDRYANIVLGGRKPDPKKHQSSYFDCEIMEIQRNKADYVWPNGNVSRAGDEHLPGTSVFGRQAFSVGSYARAQRIFDSMMKDDSDVPFAQKFERAR